MSGAHWVGSARALRRRDRRAGAARWRALVWAALLAGGSPMSVACASGPTHRCPGSLPELYDKVSPAVVSIYATSVNPYNLADPFTRIGGSGFIIDASGLVLTNSHLVFGQQTISVTLDDGSVLPASLVGADPVFDVAVVRLSKVADAKLAVMDLGDSDRALVGEEVLAIGNPLGLQQTLTRGIISAVNRTLPNVPFALTEPMIQTDAPINRGSSGGPLVDACGRVLGITSGIFPNGQNIGFAIPINLAKQLIPKLVTDGRVIRPWLGIQGQIVTKSLKDVLREPLVDGLLVEVVEPSSPAARAGVRGGKLDVVIGGQPLLLGGDIVTAINGVAIETTDQLGHALQGLHVGSTVHLTVARDDQPVYLDCVLVERPLLPGDLAGARERHRPRTRSTGARAGSGRRA